MKIQFTCEIEADVDGWATSGDGETSSAVALTEILSYLRSLNPVEGQTYLKLAAPVRAVVDLNSQ